MKAKRQAWQIEGVRKYDLDVDELTNVILKLKRIGQVPENYMYPELNRKKEQSREMQEMGQRKMQHIRERQQMASAEQNQ